MSESSEPKSPSTHILLLNYGMALFLTLAAFMLTAFLNNVALGRYVFIFLGAVILTAYWGGFGPALIVSILSVLLTKPVGIVFGDVIDLLMLVVFVLFSGFISRVKDTKARTEQALQETRRLQEIILQGVADGITARNHAGDILFANEAAARLLGYPSAKAMIETPLNERRSRYELFDEVGNPLELTSLPGRRALNEGAANELTFRLRRRETGEDQWFVIKSTPVLDDRGQPKLAINLMREITEQKKAEEERLRLVLLLEQQRRRIQTILDNVPGVVWEAKGRLDSGKPEMLFVSNYSQQLLGYTPEEWFTTPDFWQKIVLPGDWQSALEQANMIFENGKAGTMEFRLVAKDGQVVPVEAHVTLLTDDDGQQIGACGVFMDITERKQNEDNLARFAIDLQRSNKELEQFAYVASHDLQEPLRMIGSYLQLIKTRYGDKLDTDGAEFITFAIEGAARMKDLINGLLAYSRVETQPKAFTPIDSQAALDRARRLLELAIEDAEATITNDPLPQIKADEQQIVQLFQNLIGNALKYRSSERKPEIHVGAVLERGEWVFSVRDNGIGIEAQYLDRIFVIFQRLHNRGKYSGTGIGLSICKKVVERHGGHMWVESEIGKGTTFYFTIPA
jgi:PAS domain S-box-containing protein